MIQEITRTKFHVYQNFSGFKVEYDTDAHMYILYGALYLKWLKIAEDANKHIILQMYCNQVTMEIEDSKYKLQ